MKISVLVNVYMQQNLYFISNMYCYFRQVSLMKNRLPVSIMQRKCCEVTSLVACWNSLQNAHPCLIMILSWFVLKVCLAQLRLCLEVDRENVRPSRYLSHKQVQKDPTVCSMLQANIFTKRLCTLSCRLSPVRRMLLHSLKELSVWFVEWHPM